MSDQDNNLDPKIQAASDDVPVLTPEDHLRHLYVEPGSDGLFASLYKGLKATFFPEKLPPLKLTSKPVQVKNIWGLYGRSRRAWAGSMVLHVSVVTLAFALGTNETVQIKAREAITLIAPDISPFIPQAPKKQPMGGGGGGGDRSPLPASKGRLPRLAPRQFTPPTVVAHNPNPKLIMEPTIVVAPDTNLPNVNMPQFGDPLGRIGPPSSGTGSGGGIGSGSGGGVGSGRGPGFGPGEGGGFGGGVFRAGGGVTSPVVTFKVEPEYSEEARKAKFQGTVLLYIEVNERGQPQNPRIIRALGMGLDEKAIEAVMKWRFQPGRKDGRPVTVAAQVEVNFRLL